MNAPDIDVLLNCSLALLAVVGLLGLIKTAIRHPEEVAYAVGGVGFVVFVWLLVVDFHA